MSVLDQVVSADLLDPEFWGRPTAEHRLSNLTVVGPYPTVEFFKCLTEAGMPPKRLTLVVDDGWPRKTVEEIVAFFGNKKPSVRYASADGLVHAKLMLVEWLNPKANRRVRLLGWGSANASENGFGLNAEAFSFARLPTTGADSADAASILSWFENYKDKEGTSEALDVSIGRVRLRLPRIDFRSDKTPDSFASWLQSGRLCHQYDPDQQFGRLPVSLKESLPSAMRATLAQARFGKDAETRMIRYGYVDIGRKKGVENSGWRSKFFLETWLGHWTSEDGYGALATEAFIGNGRGKEELLDTVRDATDAQRKKWGDECMAHLDDLQELLRERGVSPSKHFRYENGAINKKYYRARVDAALRRQKKQAGSNAFRARYAVGFVFPPVPTLRGSTSVDGFGFEDFAVDLCDSMLTILRKGRVTNLLAQRLRKALGKELIASMSDGHELFDLLEDEWDTYGPFLRDFHKKPT